MSTFKSTLYQENGTINAIQLYNDIEKFMEAQKVALNVEQLGRRHPLQHILNSTSGGYVSPTAMKSFEGCPAGYLVNKLFAERVGSATSVGRTFHTIMQRFYDGEDRTREQLQAITDKTIEEDEQFDRKDSVQLHVDGYWDADDYEGGKMDHSALQCANEVFIKPVINPLGVSLNVPVYTLADRIDIRKSGIYVVDYKTGEGDPDDPYLLGEYGYLPQMIFYKWAVEAEYGEKVKDVLLSTPGAYTRSLRWIRMDVHSLVQQSKVIEQVSYHLEHIRRARDTKIFECKFMRYCNSCAMRDKCSVWIKRNGLDETNVAAEIPVQVEVLDKVYGEEDK